MAFPAFEGLDINIYGDPLRVVNVQPRIDDLVHPVDHDLLDEAGHLLGLLLGALDDQFVMHGEHELGVEVVGTSLMEEGYGQLETVRASTLNGMIDLLHEALDPPETSGEGAGRVIAGIETEAFTTLPGPNSRVGLEPPLPVVPEETITDKVHAVEGL